MRVDRRDSGEKSSHHAQVAIQEIARNRVRTTGLKGSPSRLAKIGIFEIIEIFFDEAAEIECFGTASFHGQAIQPVLHLAA